VRLVVRDDGKGIPAAFLPHVFERFTQADTSSTREHGGLGLGLAIARHLVELHGGSISVQSAGEGQGAAFTIRLPIAPPAELRRPLLAAAPQSVEALPASLANLRILVVDDEPDTLAVLCHGLERFGAAVVATDSVDSAIAALSTFPADVIVTDVAMPHRDGFALLRSLHAEPETPSARIPLIALTAYASSEDRQHALDAGFKLHVSKPVEPRRLAQLIAQVVRGEGQPIVVQ
jgi:CheY-like chemotaxis protein